MNESSRAASSFKETGRFRERISIRAILLLIGVFIFDLTLRIVPAISTPGSQKLVIGGVDHTRFLVGGESEAAYLLSKLDDFTAPGSEGLGREDLGVEKSASELQIQDIQGARNPGYLRDPPGITTPFQGMSDFKFVNFQASRMGETPKTRFRG